MLKLPDNPLFHSFFPFLSLQNKLSDKNYNLSIDLKTKFEKKFQTEIKKQPWLTDLDLELLLLMDSYHQELTAHSFQTCELVQVKLEKTLAFSINLNSLLSETEVSKTQLLRAALFHDLGKIVIPKTILYNQTTNEELSQILSNLLFQQKDLETLINFQEKTKLKNLPAPEQFLSTLNSLGLRAVHIVPTKFLLNKTERKDVSLKNLNLNLPLLDLIKIHEEASKEILTANNFYTEGKLAGTHHDYKKTGSSFTLDLPEFSLSFDLVEIIRLADDISALTSFRSYNKNGFSLPRTWKIILEDMRTGKFNQVLTYIWLKADVDLFLQTTNISDLNQADKENLEFVEENLGFIFEEISAKNISYYSVEVYS